MGIGNTSQQWGWLSKILHWLTAVLIFVQIPLGFYAESLKLSPLKMDIFVWHKSLGMLVFLLLILRLLWRIKGTIPKTVGASLIQQHLAQAAHYLLYGLMVLLPISGWITSSAANIPIKLFWLIPLPALVGPDDALKSLAAEVHEISVFVLLAVLILHIGAALHHHLLLRDNTLKRMWF
ncbi:cytochrome b [bacterium]|nr:cytochrome b [bacterium]